MSFILVPDDGRNLCKAAKSYALLLLSAVELLEKKFESDDLDVTMSPSVTLTPQATVSQEKTKFGGVDISEEMIMEAVKENVLYWSALADAESQQEISWWQLWPWPNQPGSLKWLKVAEHVLGKDAKIFKFLKEKYDESKEMFVME